MHPLGGQRSTRSDKRGGLMNSWSQFAAMGGYGLYVWGSFGMCIVVLVVEVALLAARRRALKSEADNLAVDVRESGV